MNRYKQREQALQLVFESQFNSDSTDEICAAFEECIGELGDYAKQVFEGVSDNAQMLDDKICEYSSGWRLQRIPKINIAILRVAMYEIIFVDDTPSEVAVNEAVELAKKYSGSDDAAFINGILGSLMRSIG